MKICKLKENKIKNKIEIKGNLYKNVVFHYKQLANKYIFIKIKA